MSIQCDEPTSCHVLIISGHICHDGLHSSTYFACFSKILWLPPQNLPGVLQVSKTDYSVVVDQCIRHIEG